MQSLILSQIDYCNVAFAGLPQRIIIRLQAVINCSSGNASQKFDHISTLMRDELQWLRIGERIRFKLSILVHKCLNNSTPPYLVDKIRLLSDDCMGGDLGGTGRDGFPQKFEVGGTAHASVLPIFGEVVLWDARESTK